MRIIVVGPGFDYYRYFFEEISNKYDYIYLSENPIGKMKKSEIIGQFWAGKLHENCKKYIGEFIQAIGKYIEKQDDEIVLVFVRSPEFTCLLEYGLFAEIKDMYPKAKIVAFLGDIVEKYSFTSIDVIKQNTDMVVTSEYLDAQRFGIVHLPITPYKMVENKPNRIVSDVYYCGAAKDRITTIKNVAKQLVNSGLHIDFNIARVDDEEKEEIEGVRYVSNLSYAENLKRLRKSRIILEVIQGGGSGTSMRLQESIRFNKLLLTNNKYLYGHPLYSKNIIFFENETIDVDKLRKMEPIDVGDIFRSQLDIDAFILYIITMLKEERNNGNTIV